MKIDLEPPIWYSNDKMYSAKVKLSDVFLDSEPFNLIESKQEIIPVKETQIGIRNEVIECLLEQIASWFTTPLNKDQLNKRLQFQFQEFEYGNDIKKWVKLRWTPRYFQVRSKSFTLLFGVHSFLDYNPRIPTQFLEAMTPRATTPTEDMEDNSSRKELRNIVLHPGAGPSDDDLAESIPFSEHPNSLELRDSSREKKKLREAELRAAIARLKVEKLRERYVRDYGVDGIEEESSDEEDSFEESEFSDASSKK